MAGGDRSAPSGIFLQSSRCRTGMDRSKIPPALASSESRRRKSRASDGADAGNDLHPARHDAGESAWPRNGRKRGATRPWRKSPRSWRTKSAIPWEASNCLPACWPIPRRPPRRPANGSSQIQAGLRTLAATVNNVLQFHSQPCPEPIPTHLDRLLRETVEFLGPLARQRGMQVRLDQSRGKSSAACRSSQAAAGVSESWR